jgi:NAD-dependent SIR2 family protein deacetylase
MSFPEIAADDFARRFAMRAPNLMWFVGAGTSASAGVPTAGDMIWEFKQRLFVSQRHVSPKSVADLSSPAIRAQLQQHIDSLASLPRAGADDEYAALFEAVFPSEQDRRTYIASRVEGAKPSYGHIALASLMKEGRCRLVWTTNFDHLNADACARVFGTTSALTLGGLDAPSLAHDAVGENRWPIEVKLHGDFRSRRLKNTAEELRRQEQQLRQLLMTSCGRFGLIVAGYSGRDQSVMDTLEGVLDEPNRFPSGLFWLLRHGETVPARVAQLLRRARSAGVEAGLVWIASFDEMLRDLVRVAPPSDLTALDEFGRSRARWSPAPNASGKRGWPVLRFNAIPLLSMPTLCRLVECEIGGTSDVKRAVEAAGVDVLAVRSRAGVLAFGSDAAVRSAFRDFSIGRFDLHTFRNSRLSFDSAERGLLRGGLTRSLQRERGLTIVRRSFSHLLAPTDTDDTCWAPLKQLVGQLSGRVPGHNELTWREGIGVRLEWASDRLWLIFEPRVVHEGVTEVTKSICADFSRERTVKRYNRVLNDIIAFWAGHLSAGQQELRALDIADGVDAVFALGKQTAFSRRGGA